MRKRYDMEQEPKNVPLEDDSFPRTDSKPFSELPPVEEVDSSPDVVHRELTRAAHINQATLTAYRGGQLLSVPHEHPESAEHEQGEGRRESTVIETDTNPAYYHHPLTEIPLNRLNLPTPINQPGPGEQAAPIHTYTAASLFMALADGTVVRVGNDDAPHGDYNNHLMGNQEMHPNNQFGETH